MIYESVSQSQHQIKKLLRAPERCDHTREINYKPLLNDAGNLCTKECALNSKEPPAYCRSCNKIPGSIHCTPHQCVQCLCLYCSISIMALISWLVARHSCPLPNMHPRYTYIHTHICPSLARWRRSTPHARPRAAEKNVNSMHSSAFDIWSPKHFVRTQNAIIECAVDYMEYAHINVIFRVQRTWRGGEWKK